MLFSKDPLFIHVPKTGGMSTTGYLLETLPRPVYLSHPVEVWNDTLGERGVVQTVGRRHETLAEARDVARHGFDVGCFPLVLATIRNPYDLEVSRYTYLRIGHVWERGPEQDLALGSSFEEFAVQNDQRGGGWATEAITTRDPAALAAEATNPDYPHELKNFYTLDAAIPPNLRVIRFEHLVEDLMDALRSVGIDGRPADVPWVNRSRQDDFLSYSTPAPRRRSITATPGSSTRASTRASPRAPGTGRRRPLRVPTGATAPTGRPRSDRASGTPHPR